MTNEIKNYITYFVKSNRRILILEFIIMFIAIPFMVYNSVSSEFLDITTFLNPMMTMSILCMCALSVLTPMYIFRYLHKKQSCDLYFSLPIKRAHQFLLQFILGALLALVPLYLNGILASIIVCAYQGGLILNIIGFYMILTLTFFIIYSFFSFIVLKCNNILDSIIVPGAYTILPIVVGISAVSFVNVQIANILVSYSIRITEIMWLEKIFILVLFPFVVMRAILDGSMNFDYLNNVEVAIYSIIWILIGVFCFYLARKAYLDRKEEDAEQRTTSLCAFPFIVLAVTASLVLLVFNDSSAFITPTIIIFVLYIVMIFFANRKIKLKLNHIIAFALIYVLVFGFTIAFQKTKFFGLVKEVPSAENISEVLVHFSDDNGPIKNYTIVYKNDIKEIIGFQEKLVEKGRSKSNIHPVYIRIEYNLKGDKKWIDRSYQIFPGETSKFIEEVENCISK